MTQLADQALVATIARRMGSDLLPDNDQWTNRMEIRSASSTRLYVVSQNKKTGTWGCSCPGWRTRRKCKHLEAMVPLLEGPSKTGAPPRPALRIEAPGRP